MPRPGLLPALFLLASALAAGSAHGQRGNGRVTGTVIDKATRAPLPGVTVVNLLDGKATTTDSVGAYRFEKLPSGIVRFLFRVQGFPQQGVVVALAQGEAMERLVEMDSSTATVTAQNTPAPNSRVQQLAPVTITETPSLGPRFANFERRRKTGAGQYATREEIEKMGANMLTDVVRTMRGVQLDCGDGRIGCAIRMTRAPMRCPPEYIVDENVDNFFGPTVPIRDIEALEVYTGATDVPGEYAGRNAGCGVIVIWTKSGPARRKKK